MVDAFVSSFLFSFEEYLTDHSIDCHVKQVFEMAICDGFPTPESVSFHYFHTAYKAVWFSDHNIQCIKQP